MSEESGLPGGQNPDNERLMLALAYFGPLGLIPYLTMADNDFVRWHARQGLTLTGVWILAYITIGLLAPIPLLGWMLVLLAPLAGLAVLALVIVAITYALRGQRWRIPLIADLADKW